MSCGLRVAGSRFLLFTIRLSLLAIRYPLPCRFADFTICRQVFGRANFLVSPIWVRGAECGCQAKIFGNAGALPHKTTRYSLFAIRYSPVAAIFGFNWRVVLPHNRKQIRLLRRAALQFRSRTTEIFRHGRAVPSRKTIRHLLLAVHHSLSFWL
jgi:hypothetical protein